MKKVIDQVRPDIIHAHNVFSAKMAKEIDKYPIVYDNHEYWSKFLVSQYESSTDIDYYDTGMMEKIRRNVTTFTNQIKKKQEKNVD